MNPGATLQPLPDVAALFSLAGRRALVTGASRGIGRGIARALAAAGADVAVHYHSSADAARDLADSIVAAGRRAVAIQADLSRPGAGAGLAEEAVEALGGVDVLVLGAAEQRRAPLEHTRQDDYDLQVATGFHASFELVRALLPAMRAQRFGRIIAISSVQQLRPNPELPVYAAMKAALANLMRNLGKPSAADGVTCNTILPGLIDTDRIADIKADAEAYGWLLDRIPAHRAGGVDEVAALALYLAGPAGGYATGCDFLVDGGLSLP